jgi:hypothetical protein
MKSSDKMVATEASTPGQPLGMNLSLGNPEDPAYHTYLDAAVRQIV